MKNYSSSKSQKGKTAFRTPSRWIKGQPELYKRKQGTKLNYKLHLAGRISHGTTSK